MPGKCLKICFILPFCLFAVSSYSGDQPPRTAAARSYYAAPPASETGEFASAQFWYGVYCREVLKNDDEAFRFLELSAKQNYRDAWLYLGQCYLNMADETNSFLLWAKLCYLAAERIKPCPMAEFGIGCAEGMSGNEQEFIRWMKLAAEKGHKKAADAISDKDIIEDIRSIRKRRDTEKSANPLKQSLDSHVEKLGQLTGPEGKEIIQQFLGISTVSEISRMIRLPHPANISLPGWDFDFSAVDDKISRSLMTDRQGDTRWMTEEFLTQPIWENLLYPNPTIRRINYEYEDALEGFLKKSPFRLCGKEETGKLLKYIMLPDVPAEYYAEDRIWDLGNGIYFRINESDGAWRLRDYNFFVIKNDKVALTVSFPNPPDAGEAAMIYGTAAGDNTCLNNLAVSYADGKMDQVCRLADEAEPFLKELAKRRHAIGTYNLAVFYQARNNPAEAEKYYKLAEEFAGNSVISPAANPPEIFDRNGELLVKNRLFRTGTQNNRIFMKDGKFAATLIGHTSSFEGQQGKVFEGRSGIEQIISQKNIRHPVFLTIDSRLQTQLETLLTEIAEKSDPRYAYAVIVSSKGELAAAAQSSVFDLKIRDGYKKNPAEDWNGWLFMPAGYIFPVADQWMKLLGSSSYASPASKKPLKLHIKQGIFAEEAQGIVLGINRMEGETDPRKVSGQTATMLNYVCAYIGVAEKKNIPALTVYTDKKNIPLNAAPGIEWISFYRPPDGIVVNALGVIKCADPENKLYICVRAVYEERDFGSPPSEEAKVIARLKADKAAEIIRDFPFGKE